MAAMSELIPTEESEQAALFEWAAYNDELVPELAALYAIPNGGYRHVKTAVTLKRTGVKAGVPDICLPVPRDGKHGLYLEMKRRKGGEVSVSQRTWLNFLAGQGYATAVCRGWEEAVQVISAYLGLPGSKT